jgi:serine protease inhibitor
VIIPFNVNRPFIFMIVDNTSNTVLFMGRVNDPLSPN